MSRIVEISLSQQSNALIRVRLDDPLGISDNSARGQHWQPTIVENVNELAGANIGTALAWCADRMEWTAIDLENIPAIPVDMMLDEPYWRPARALDSIAKRLLASIFEVDDEPGLREHVHRLSPAELRAIASGRKQWRDTLLTAVSIPAEHIHRLNELRTRTRAYNFETVPFDGHDTSDEKAFRFRVEHVKPPARLFTKGRNWQVLNSEEAVSFGGKTSPRSDSFRFSELLAQVAAKRGAVVISGGVIGVDMAAHLGALDVGGATVAVLAGPVDKGLHPYIPERRFLHDGILDRHGLLLSEYDTEAKDEEEHQQRCLQRDRIITALSDVFVAVECSRNSATVDAAKRAKIQGKRVVAVDWSRIEKTWGGVKPDTTGAQQLMEENVAEGFPATQVKDIRAPELVEQFGQMFEYAAVGRALSAYEQYLED